MRSNFFRCSDSRSMSKDGCDEGGGEDTDAFAVIPSRRSKTKDLTAGVTSSFCREGATSTAGFPRRLRVSG